MTQAEINQRLQEIQGTSLHDLDDAAVLAILSERKTLLVEALRLEEDEKKQAVEALLRKQEQEKLQALAHQQELEEKKNALVARLAEINKNITSDQDDEKLMALIQERKVLEVELRVFTIDTRENTEVPLDPIVPFEPEEVAQAVLPPEEVVTVSETLAEPAPLPVETEKEVPAMEESLHATPITEANDEKITINSNVDYVKSSHVSSKGKVSLVESTSESIVLDSSLQTSEYQGYLNELKENLNSLGTFLQGLPITVKRSRAFMLEVAKIDPAYAMHYADKDTLKKDETFNVTIAGMNNQRNTGNPLSEMLPEMRTGPVLLAGVKNDYRNVRFALPQMPEYEQILALAQKGALEAVTSLKEAHDVRFLLPPILQKDKAFMQEVEKALAKK